MGARADGAGWRIGRGRGDLPPAVGRLEGTGTTPPPKKKPRYRGTAALVRSVNGACLAMSASGGSLPKAPRPGRARRGCARHAHRASGDTWPAHMADTLMRSGRPVTGAYSSVTAGRRWRGATGRGSRRAKAGGGLASVGERLSGTGGAGPLVGMDTPQSTTDDIARGSPASMAHGDRRRDGSRDERTR